MSELSLKSENKYINHILNVGKFLICLVCKTKVAGIFNLDHNILLKRHINSKIHNKNVRALFKLCMPNWNGSYVDLIKKLLFDVSFERKESSCVLKTGFNYACLVCHEQIIAQGTDSNEITMSIKTHVQTDFHLNNLKEEVKWVYPLGEELDFIMFQKSEVYCSLCKEDFNVITCAMKRAVEHLRAYHNSLYQTITKPQNKDGCADEKSICESLKSLTLSDNNSPLIPQSSSSQRNLVPEFSLDTRQRETDQLEASAVFHVNLDESEESSNESDDICVEDLLCPECGELIEVYNENADFSIDLHLQKHKPLMSFSTEGEFDYQEDADYVCQICQETVQIFNKDLKISINRHFQDKKHEHGKFTSEDCSDKNKFDFFKSVFDILPDNMHDQRSIFVMDRNEVFCKLCSCTVSLGKNVSDACRIIIEHTKSTFHVDQFEVSNQFLTLALSNSSEENLSPQNSISPSKECDESKNKIKNTILQLSDKFPVIGLSHVFIKEKYGDFFCEICQVLIKFCENGADLKKHCASFSHNTALLERSLRCLSQFQHKNLTGTIGTVAKSFFGINKFKPHVHFLNHNGIDFCCIICEIAIPGSRKTGKNISTHFYSVEHRERFFEVISNQD